MDKEEFLEKAMHANEGAIKESKISDLTNKDSAFYTMPEAPKENVEMSQVEKSPDEIPRIKTFSADVSNAVNEENLSISKIALAESEKKNTIQDTKQAQEPKNWFAIVSVSLGTMLIVGAISAIGFVWYSKHKTEQAVVEIPTVKDFIRLEETRDISIKNISSELMSTEISKERKNPPAQNGIRKINFLSENDLEKTALNTNTFFNTLESKIPDALLRNLSEQFLVAIHFSKGEGHPFLVLKGESFEALYSGMLLYETDLKDDVALLFGKKEPWIFNDLTILNKDVRAVTDTNGNPLFFYGIIDNQYVVMTDNINTFEEVLKRLRE